MSETKTTVTKKKVKVFVVKNQKLEQKLELEPLNKENKNNSEANVTYQTEEADMGVEIDFGVDQVKTIKFWRAILAEFFGMIFFLLCVTTVAQPWTAAPDPSANHVEIGIGIGLAITTTAMMVGHVSGGHLNPAVTLGMIFGGRISVLQGLLYIPAQMVGAIVGSSFTYGLTPGVKTLGVTSLTPGLSSAQGFGLELLFTFVLVFFVFSITDPAKKVGPAAATLGIGVCIWVCHVCLIGYTGCGINPARSFGPAVIMNSWENHWVYWIGPFVGGALAGLIYNILFFHEKEKAENYDLPA